VSRQSRHTGFTGSELVRLLARLAGAGAHESRKQDFADRLGQWLSWTDAIALSAALEGGATVAAAPGRRDSGCAEEGEWARARAALQDDITQDGAAFAAGQAQEQPAAPVAKADFAPYRRHYLARQQAMQAALGAWRGRLRAALARRSPAMAQLAAVDAVMEQVLGTQEHSLLSTVPALLEQHFRRLHDEAKAHAPASDAQAPIKPGAWLDVFCKDMQAVMLAELELRYQPVEGLIDALRTRQQQPVHHE
jgi:hypothetical protein